MERQKTQHDSCICKVLSFSPGLTQYLHHHSTSTKPTTHATNTQSCVAWARLSGWPHVQVHVKDMLHVQSGTYSTTECLVTTATDTHTHTDCGWMTSITQEADASLTTIQINCLPRIFYAFLGLRLAVYHGIYSGAVLCINRCYIILRHCSGGFYVI